MEMMFVAIGVVLWPVAVLLYVHLNRTKAAAQQRAVEEGKKYSSEDLRRMGDRAPDFVYTI